MNQQEMEGPDRELLSNIQHLKDFKNISGWLDVKGFIEDRIAVKQHELESAVDIEHVRRCQGALEQLRDILDLPDWFINELQLTNEIEE